MNGVMNMGNTMLKAGQSVEVLIALIVVGILVSFFGLKLVRILAVLIGLILGGIIGLLLAHTFGWSGFSVAIVTFGCMILMAALSFFLYRLGVFFTVFLSALVVMAAVCYPASNTLLLAYAAVSLVLGVLAAIFVEPIIIVMTAISGAMNATKAIVAVAGLTDQPLIMYGIAAVIAVVGMAIQFMMHSRKIAKKQKQQAEIIKEQDSVESEVEKARLILDDFDENEVE